MQEFYAGILDRELPVHGRAQGVAVGRPGLDLDPQSGLACDMSVQTLRYQGRELDFGDVKPAAVLSRLLKNRFGMPSVLPKVRGRGV